MVEKKDKTCKECGVRNSRRRESYNGGGGAVYGLGFVGALVYFIQNADSFWAGALGVLEAIVWPAVLVYKALANLIGA